MVKGIRLLVLLGAVAIALPFGLMSAGATGGGGSGTQVTIQEHADYDFIGTNLDVGLQVRCTDPSGFGSVDVTVNQSPPETPYPFGAGSGPQSVVCDGHTHTVGVTIIGAGFDAGRAKATAALTLPLNSSGSKTVVRWITIVVV
jgi:hypothetical protein